MSLVLLTESAVVLCAIMMGFIVVVVLSKAFSVVVFNCVALWRMGVVILSDMWSVGALEMFPGVGKVVVYVSVVFDWLVLNCVVLTAGRDVVLNSDVVLEVSVMLILRSASVPLMNSVVFCCVVLYCGVVVLKVVELSKYVVVLNCAVSVVVNMVVLFSASVVSNVELS